MTFVIKASCQGTATVTLTLPSGVLANSTGIASKVPGTGMAAGFLLDGEGRLLRSNRARVELLHGCDACLVGRLP